MLFDSSDEENEEVSLRAPEDSNSSEEDSTDLHNEVEARLGTESGTSSSSSTSTGTGTSTMSGSSSSVSLKDIKEQNEEIISLLRDIKNDRSSSGSQTEDNNSGTRGDPSELL